MSMGRYMNEFRVFVAVSLFCISSYLAYDLIANGFNWVVLAICILGYVLVHYIWPKNKDDDSAWYDLLEIVVDLPFRAMATLLRSIGRIAKSANGDIGTDL